MVYPFGETLVRLVQEERSNPPDTMKINQITIALAGLLAMLLTGCSATDTTADFGKISSTGPGHSTDTTRSGEMDGIGFVHRY